MIGGLLGLLSMLTQAPAGAPPQRVYEIRVDAPAPPGDSAGPDAGQRPDLATSAAALHGPFETPEELADFLRRDGFDALVVWIPAPAPPSVELPVEPRAREWPEADASLDDPGLPWLASARATLGIEGLRLAVGVGTPPDDSGSQHRGLIWTGDGAETFIPRLVRPAVRDHLWWDPAFWRAPAGAGSVSLSTDLLAPCRSELRPLQAGLDGFAVRCLGRTRDRDLLQLLQAELGADRRFATWCNDGADPSAAALALLAQSRLASDVARNLGGIEPQRLLVFENEWLGERTSGRSLPSRRRPPARLDLDEWAFSESAEEATPAVCVARPADLLPPPWDSEAGGDAPLAPPLTGLLSAADRRAFREFAQHRLQAAHELAWLLAKGEDARREAAFDRLRRSREAARTFGPALAPALDPGVDHEAVRDADRWRVEPTQWTLHEIHGSRRKVVCPVTTWRIDETRYGGWPRAMLMPRDGVNLREVFASSRGRHLVLTTEFPLSETRTMRLRIGGPFRMGVALNEAILAQSYPGTQRGPLLLALSLASALNRLEVELYAEDEVAVLPLELMPVPRQFEGVTLPPTRATRIQEPLARLHHPLALDDEVLVVPDVPRPGTPPVGEAEFHFETRAERRWDLWVHGTAPADRIGRLQFQVDGRVVEAVLPPGAGWRWVRLAEPLTLAASGHQVLLRLSEPGVVVDGMHFLITGSQFPRPPSGDGSLSDFAWRFDPLGRGHRFNLPALSDQRTFQRAFTAEQSGHYDVYVWLRGTRPLQAGDSTQVELSTRSLSQRFFLPDGAPVEEWVRVGFLNLSEGDTVQMRAHGEGAPAFLCLIPG